jgi:uncharacterized membrane protein
MLATWESKPKQGLCPAWGLEQTCGFALTLICLCASLCVALDLPLHCLRVGFALRCLSVAFGFAIALHLLWLCFAFSFAFTLLSR